MNKETRTAAGLETTDKLTGHVYFSPNGIRLEIERKNGSPGFANGLEGVFVPFEKIEPLIEEAYAAKQAELAAQAKAAEEAKETA